MNDDPPRSGRDDHTPADRLAMGKAERAALERIKSAKNPLVVVRVMCGKSRHTLATVHPTSRVVSESRVPGVSPPDRTRWGLWLRAAPVWVRAARIQDGRYLTAQGTATTRPRPWSSSASLRNSSMSSGGWDVPAARWIPSHCPLRTKQYLCGASTRASPSVSSWVAWPRSAILERTSSKHCVWPVRPKSSELGSGGIP